MAQPSPPVPSNGVPSPAAIPDAIDTPESTNSTLPVKRKREDGEPGDEDAEMKMDVDTDQPSIQDMKDAPELIQKYFRVVSRYATVQPSPPAHCRANNPIVTVARSLANNLR